MDWVLDDVKELLLILSNVVIVKKKKKKRKYKSDVSGKA